MKSGILTKDKKALVALCKSMTPEQRLEAFYNHSRLMSEFYQEGFKLRRRVKTLKSSKI